MTDEFSNKPNHLLDLIKPEEELKEELKEENNINNNVTVKLGNKKLNEVVTFKLDNKRLMPVKEYVTVAKDEYEKFKNKYSKSKAKLKQIKRILDIKHV